MMRSRVFTIPPNRPFLPTLARALVTGELIAGFAPHSDPLALSAATIYLPTRRAARAFADALLDALDTDAALLPRIVPLGEVDEDALAFAESDPGGERPSAISPTARRLILARLVSGLARSTARGGRPLLAETPTAALQLADELARLFDDLTIGGISFDVLEQDGFVPTTLDEYWQRSLEFLRLARTAWEAHLEERALIDPTVWRDRMLAQEAARIAGGTDGPTVAAGSTGTIPAVAHLIQTIAARSDGAVVLPGLDQLLDEDSFGLIDGGTLGGNEVEPSPGHPQFGLKRLLGRLKLSRRDIPALGAGEDERARLLSEAFRPAATTHLWRTRGEDFATSARHGLAGVTLIEAAAPREEALALALLLRETLEQPGLRAALITPDRPLARRVAAELRRWDIEVDDSAGLPLRDTEAGRFAQLVLDAAAEQFAPIPLLSLLRHPLASARFASPAIDALEIAALRGPRPAPGGLGLARAVAEAHALFKSDALHRRDPRARLSEREWLLAAEVAREVGAALEPLAQLGPAEIRLQRLLQLHHNVLTALGLDLTAAGGADVRALADAFAELTIAAEDAAPLRLVEYAGAFGELLAGAAPMRQPFDRHAHIRILGPLEARLLDCDRVLLGGLNEGAWPPETHVDAWLNRPMRARLKLDLPERRIGLSAHDFVQALGTREVILSRARKQDGVETVASRFLLRLQAITPDSAWREACARGVRYLAIVRQLERPEKPRPIARPAPRPPVEARPARLSVTEIETLIRDPYSIYARHVLALHPLDPIDADPGAAERGSIIHEALAEFTRAHPAVLPGDALTQLLACGRRAFDAVEDFPSIKAMWWPRFERVARWLVEIEAERRRAIEAVLAETNGAMEFDAGGRAFRLTARADRIERRRDGTVAIIDYKTGEPPTLKQAIVGLAPQLPLEAAIAKAGGFAELPDGVSIADILVIKPSGREPPGEVRSLNPQDAKGDAKALADTRGIASADDLAEYARARGIALLAAFADPGAAYHSIPRPKWRGRFGRYDHLARIKEWAASDEVPE